MKVIDLDAIDRTKLQRDPFEYFVVPGCIDQRALATIAPDYPDIDRPGNLALDDVDYGPAFRSFLDELQSSDFAEHVGRKFGLELVECPTTITVRKFCEKSDGNIHTDHPSKIVTVLVYFNTNWADTGGQLRMLRSASDIEDFAAEVPPLGGTLLAFRRSGHSYHGHKEFIGERRMVQMNFLQANKLAQWKQQIDRLGTHTMKKALRLFGANA